MQAGKMDKKIDIQRSTYEVNEYGTPVYTWTTFATVRAQVLQSGSEEFIRAYGASEETVTIFRIRFVSGVSTANRIIYKGKQLDIKEITEIQRRRGLELRTLSFN